MAMPPPMVPAPMMPTVFTSRGTTESSTPATFAAVRSAKNTWRSAADCGCIMQAMNALRSSRMPSANGLVTAASTRSTICWCANKLRLAFARPARAVAKKSAGREAGSMVRTLTKGSAEPLATTSCANAIAPVSRSPSTMRSMTPAAAATLAGTGSPLKMTSSAVAGPTRRGRRCVPPAPGSRPSFTSGRPTFAEATATR